MVPFTGPDHQVAKDTLAQKRIIAAAKSGSTPQFPGRK
jgi:hypothetical protein